MDYMDVKALSEVVESYEKLFGLIREGRRALCTAGIDAETLKPALFPLMRELCRGKREAQRRYDAAFRLYLDGLPTHETGRAA